MCCHSMMVALTQMSRFRGAGLGAGCVQGWNLLLWVPGGFAGAGVRGGVNACVRCCSLQGRPMLRLTQPGVLI